MNSAATTRKAISADCWTAPSVFAGVAADALGDPARGEPGGGHGGDRRQGHEEALAEKQQEGEHGADADGEPDVVVGRLADLRAEPVGMHRRIGEQRIGDGRARQRVGAISTTGRWRC